MWETFCHIFLCEGRALKIRLLLLSKDTFSPDRHMWNDGVGGGRGGGGGGGGQIARGQEIGTEGGGRIYKIDVCLQGAIFHLIFFCFVLSRIKTRLSSRARRILDSSSR